MFFPNPEYMLLLCEFFLYYYFSLSVIEGLNSWNLRLFEVIFNGWTGGFCYDTIYPFDLRLNLDKNLYPVFYACIDES